jgi:tRNA A-37 threonylcarbamoyl transferase component Bud32
MKYKVINKNFESFIKNIKEYLMSNDGEVIFQKRNTIKKVEFNSTAYVIKSFKIPHLLNKVVYKLFRKSKARRSYENSVRLMDLGINTPKPIGYLENQNLFFLLDSYYVCEFFDYDFEIRAVFKDKNFINRDIILKEFVAFSYDLHNKGVYHIDYSPGNILVKKRDDEYDFFLIDVNRMKFLEFDNDFRMKAMMKLTSDFDDNNFMVKEYALLSGIDKKNLSNSLHNYLIEQQKYLDNKKRMKKLKGK